MWFNHPEETWSPAQVTTGGNEDVSIEMVDGGLVRANVTPSRPGHFRKYAGTVRDPRSRRVWNAAIRWLSGELRTD